MIENNLILELLKIEIKAKRLCPKDIFSIDFDDDKKVVNDLFIGLTLDVSTFDENLVMDQLNELHNYKIEQKIGKTEVFGSVISNSIFSHSDGIVNFSMYRHYFENLKKECSL